MTLAGIERIAAAHGLVPHPYEGWFRETGHVAGEERTILQLIAAGQFVPWYRLSADCRWGHEAGDPAILSTSPDGVRAAAITIAAGGREAAIAAGTWQTIETSGRWTMLRVVMVPDIAVSDRELAPEQWAPGHPLR